MHILSTRSYEAKEQLGDDEEELGVTFDLQNTQTFCLSVFVSHIKKVFYIYVHELCRSAFYVFYCFIFVFSSRHPLCPVSVFYSVKNHNDCLSAVTQTRAVPLWVCPPKRRSVSSVFLIYLVP